MNTSSLVLSLVTQQVQNENFARECRRSHHGRHLEAARLAEEAADALEARICQLVPLPPRAY